MAKVISTTRIEKPRKKRKGVHSKNASKGQNKYKKTYRGQGRQDMDIFWICIAIVCLAPHLADIINAIKGNKQCKIPLFFWRGFSCFTDKNKNFRKIFVNKFAKKK